MCAYVKVRLNVSVRHCGSINFLPQVGVDDGSDDGEYEGKDPSMSMRGSIVGK